MGWELGLQEIYPGKVTPEIKRNKPEKNPNPSYLDFPRAMSWVVHESPGSFLGTGRRNRESFREDISGPGGKGTENQGNSKSKDTERDSTKTKEMSNNVYVARILRE